MPNYKGKDTIVLQPADENVTYTFHYETKASATDKSGDLPFGTTISGADVTVAKSDGTDATDDILYATPIPEDNELPISYKYPSVNGDGTYYVRVVLVLSDGTTFERDWHRVKAIDL